MAPPLQHLLTAGNTGAGLAQSRWADLADDTPVVLITRPLVGARHFADLLDLPNVISPILKLVPIGRPAEVPTGAMAIFTSGAALRLGQVVPIAERISAYCVGSATTDLARSFGFSSQQAGETVQQLRQSLIDAPPRAPLMHFRGRHSTGDLAKELQLAGLQCQERIVYDQTSQNLSDAAKKLLESGRDVIAPVFSSRSAAILSGQLEICSGRLFLVAISQKVADQWAGAQPHRIICALTPDQNAMQIAVKETYAALQ